MVRLRDQVLDLRGHVERSMAEVVAGAAALRSPGLDLPPREARLLRFGYGVGLPVALGRVVLADRAFRRRYFQVVGAQLAVMAVVAALAAILGWDELDGVAFWSSLYGVLCGVEWVVLALSRDYHAGLTRELCERTGVPPEDEAKKPAIRFDVRWLTRKIKSRIRGFFVFGSALPLFATIAFFGPIGRAISAVLFTIWSVYWAGAFTAAKTAYGWVDDGRAPDPIFLRAWGRWTQPLPGVIRWAPTWYGRVWAFLTRPLFAPAIRFEASPYEISGLSLARVVRHLPGIYLVVRPLFGAAAAHAVLGEVRRRAIEAQRSLPMPDPAEAQPRVAEDPAEEDASAEIAAACEREDAKTAAPGR